MLVLTRDIVNPYIFNASQRGIGISHHLEIVKHESYFYCRYHDVRNKNSAIFCVRISKEQTDHWEFVGELDFCSHYMTISPCGKYFWSLEIIRYEQVIFRQIDIRTLECDEFQMPELDFLGRIGDVRFHYTQNWGAFLIVQRRKERIAYDENSDAIFCCRMDKRIKLPDVSTVQPYPMSRRDDWYKKVRYGLIDDRNSLFFYQIDYFGDVFVLEWSEFKLVEWVKFEVEGDKFKSWMASEDRNFSNHRNESALDQWNYGMNQLNNNERCHLSNNIVYCTHVNDRFSSKKEPQTNFYYCKFRLEDRVCESKCIFSTHFPFTFLGQHAITSEIPVKKSITFFFNKSYSGHSKAFCWEQVVVGEVPTLLTLTHICAQKILKEQGESVNLQFLDEEKLIPLFRTKNQVPEEKEKKLSLMEQVMEVFKRPFAKNKQNTSLFVIKERSGENAYHSRAYKKGSNVCENETVKVLSIPSYLNVKKLLKNLK